jgi:hypothetical protein
MLEQLFGDRTPYSADASRRAGYQNGISHVVCTQVFNSVKDQIDDGVQKQLLRDRRQGLVLENVAVVTLLPVCRQLFKNPATQGFGSIPMRSLTADRIRCLQPRYRSVV